MGNGKQEHRFTLKQSPQIFRYYEESSAACDEEIEKLVVAFAPRVDPVERPLPPDRQTQQRKRKRRGVNPGVHPKTGFDMRTEIYKLFGGDVTQISGLMVSPLLWLSEIGRTCQNGPPPITSAGGWASARTTISAAGGFCGPA